MDSGIYLLEIRAGEAFRLGIKKFSDILFPAGFYYYAGSAQKNLTARIERHKLKKKIIHWHIDHITVHRKLEIISISVFQDQPKQRECELVAELIGEFNLSYATHGFGNSDCNSCGSHLLYSKKKISHSHFIRRYHSMVRFIPS